MPLKVTSWNVEHSASLIGQGLDDIRKNRRDRVAKTIRDINPDVLCMLEGPKGEEDIVLFSDDVLDKEWVPVLLHELGYGLGQRDQEYDIRGNQWIWFLVKPHLIDRCRIQAPSVWKSFVGHARWKVHYWGNRNPTWHYHYRHPQVLIIDLGNGKELEIIGQHMKSKINRSRIEKDSEGNIIGDYLDTALKARIKMATEARNIRSYIDARFDQNPNPGILIVGDANDGIGQDYFERKYMFFDLISNLQGQIMNAERFFNHALFDYPSELRWTAKYRDPVLNIPASKNPLLIDHILMSQALVSGELPLVIESGAGQVEHQAFERGNAGASAKRKTSDHRPVSVILSDNH
ncbi:MAG: hypothetical protein ACRBB4_15735 [Neptuniibacter sp.]